MVKCMVITRQLRNHPVVPMAVVTHATEGNDATDTSPLHVKADQIISDFRKQFPEFKDAFFEKHIVDKR